MRAPSPLFTLGLCAFAIGCGIGIALVLSSDSDDGDVSLIDRLGEAVLGSAGDETPSELDLGGGAGDDDAGAGTGDAGAEAGDPGCEPAPLAQRAGATLIAGLPEATDADHDAVDALDEANVGGVFLTRANIERRWQARTLIRGLRRRLGPDLLVTVDEETGRVSSFRDVVGPTSAPRTTARTLEPQAWRERAEELGETLADVGVDWNFAPVADLDAGPPGGTIGDRSFSDDPDRATDFVLAFAEGLARAGVTPTVKHFPGHGSATGDPHRETVEDDRSLAELRAADLQPFAAAIDAGVPAVMVSHVVHTALDADRPASLAPETYALLRDLGFEGVAITDSLGMGALHQRYGYAVASVDALAAGADAMLVSDGRAAPQIVDAIVAAVEDGDLAEDRLDAAATRVLTLAGRDPEEVTCREPSPSFPEGPVGDLGVGAVR